MTAKTQEPKTETDNKPVITDYTSLTNFKGTHQEIGIIKKTICKDLTDGEFLHFLNYCAEVKLHPLLKEVWVYKKSWGDKAMEMFVGRDGHFTNAQRHPDYRGYKSAAVYEHDEFEVDFSDLIDPVKHKAKGFDRGLLLGAYAICYRKDCPPSISIVKLPDYSKKKKALTKDNIPAPPNVEEETTKKSAWDKNEMDMIIIRAEDKAFKKQFNVSGASSPYDWKQNADGSVEPINQNEETQEDLQLEAEQELLELWEECKSKDRNYFKSEILREKSENKLTIERINEWKEILTAPKEKFKADDIS